MSTESELKRESQTRGGRSRVSPADQERALEQLREVLTRPAIDRLAQVERKLAAGGVDAATVAGHLPRATAMVQGNSEFARALAPTVEDAIQVSVRKNPQPLVDAIFPIIGPAIRRSIQTALAGMTEGMNSSLESSFKLKGVRRWIKAKRTGRTVGELALLESLVYRVEQVLWIENETGLLLANVSDPQLTTRDPDLVSSMLAALQDYVGDSFGNGEANERTQLQEIEFGEQQLAIFRGPRSSLAALVRGRASAEWRVSAQELLERLHLGASEELAEFDGDVAPFESFEGELETALEERKREGKPSYTAQIVFAALAALAIFASVRAFNQRNQVRRSWSAVVESYEEEPGVEVLTREARGEILQVTLLRDPLARTEEEILAGINDTDRGRVQTREIAYLATDPVLLLRRAESVLEPPSSVKISLDEDRLILRGEASGAWIQRAEQRVVSLVGIRALDRSELVNREARGLSEAVRNVSDFDLTAFGGAREAELLERLIDRLVALDDLALKTGSLARVTVSGESSDALAQALRNPNLPRVFIEVREGEASAPLAIRVEVVSPEAR